MIISHHACTGKSRKAYQVWKATVIMNMISYEIDVKEQILRDPLIIIQLCLWFNLKGLCCHERARCNSVLYQF